MTITAVTSCKCKGFHPSKHISQRRCFLTGGSSTGLATAPRSLKHWSLSNCCVSPKANTAHTARAARAAHPSLTQHAGFMHRGANVPVLALKVGIRAWVWSGRATELRLKRPGSCLYECLSQLEVLWLQELGAKSALEDPTS